MRYGSTFSGIGGIDLGLEQAGALEGFPMECAWQCEINRACRVVLDYHWPGVRKFKDIRGVTYARLGSELRAVDLICGGFPCQDLSVAGKRKEQAGSLSSQSFEFHRLLREIRPRWVLVENVTGLLHSHGGRDFSIVLGGLTGIVPAVPAGGWASAGVARGPFYHVAWRVFDSQYFGVVQRRRRVFIVGYLGAGHAAKVLFDGDSSTWDHTPSREKGQRIAGTLAAGSHASGFNGQDAERGNLVLGVDVRNLKFQTGEVSGTIQSKPTGGHSYNFLNPVLTAQGFSTSGHGFWREGIGPLPERQYKDSENGIVVFDRTRGTTSGEISGTLRACGAQGAGINDGKADAQCIAFTERTRAQGRTLESQEELSYALTDPGAGGKAHCRSIAGTFGVRRLTPVECERLQGFPDGWTMVMDPAKRKRKMQEDEWAYLRRHFENTYGRPGTDEEIDKLASDSARYRQTGDAVTVTAARWIGRRIINVEREIGK